MDANFRVQLESGEEVDYEGINIQSSIENIGGEFSITGIHEKEINIGAAVFVTYKEEPISVGYCIRNEIDYSKGGGTKINAYCVDVLGYLNNCQIPCNKTYENEFEADIADDIIDELHGLGLPEIITEKKTRIKSFCINSGESIGSALGRLSCESAKFIYLSDNRYFEFAKAAERIGSTPLIIDIGRDLVKSINVVKNIEGSASVVCGRTHFDFENSKRHYVGFPVKLFPKGLSMPNYITGTNSLEEIKTLCERRCCEVANDIYSAKIELAGVSNQKNSVWKLNNKVIIKDATNRLKFGGELNIKRVEFRQNKTDGTSTVLTLGGLYD